MTIELEPTAVPPGTTLQPTTLAPSQPPAPARQRRLDLFDAAVLAAFALLSMWIVGLDVFHAIVGHRAWTGTDGVYVVDQLQYLAWIQSAAHHFLVANLFVLRPTPADYFQPAVVVSAGLTVLGVPAWLSLLLWKPVAVLATFLAVRQYCRRSLLGRWPRRVALVLGLFFGSFTLIYGDFGVIGDFMALFSSWGYTFGLLALAAMVFALLEYDRARRTGRRLWLAGALGALAGLLHPWQGELLIVLIVFSELVSWRGWESLLKRLRLPAITLLLTGLPLLYYWILGKTDESWELARVASRHSFPLTTVLVALAPLLIPAALSYRAKPVTFLGVVSRVWPFAALSIFFVSASGAGATPLHAFEGITLPLAVLAVEGVQSLDLRRFAHRRLLIGSATVAVTVPATLYLVISLISLAAPAAGNANFITKDEQRALTFLAADPQPGGVLTRFYLGTVVPASTGRRTYVGDCLWSQPNCSQKADATSELLAGQLSTRAARNLVSSSGARFLLADCAANRRLRQKLAGVITLVRRFGCASVYEIS